MSTEMPLGTERLSVNINEDTARLIRVLKAELDMTATEVVREAFAVWNLLRVEAAKGNEIGITSPNGRKYWKLEVGAK